MMDEFYEPCIDELSDFDEINEEDNVVPLRRYVRTSSDEESETCDSTDSTTPPRKRRTGIHSGLDSPSSTYSGVPVPASVQIIAPQRNRANYVWVEPTRVPVVDNFLGQQGPSEEVEVCDVDDPLEYFSLMFTNEFLQHIVKETNDYFPKGVAARERVKGPSGPNARHKSWKDLTVSELKIYLGLIILTGILDKKGGLDSYWSTDALIETSAFHACMSHNRFQLINMYLHFNGDVPEGCTDCLFKLRPIYDHLLEKWQSLYSLGEHIAIDEGMMKWRGRLHFRVYNKDKPIEYGIKSYILADSATHYCYNLDIYCKQKKTLRETIFGLLTDKCFNLWHSLYMDNFYNSVELSEALLEKGIHTVGTIRKFRGEPKDLRESKPKPGQWITRDNGKVFVLYWSDKNLVKTISTKHNGSQCCEEVRRKKNSKEMEVVAKPASVSDYNKHMSGCDNLDQMISYYPYTRKSTKWTKKLFFYLMEISIHNCFVLYKAKSVNNKMSFYSFNKELARGLCGEAGVESGTSNFIFTNTNIVTTLEKIPWWIQTPPFGSIPINQRISEFLTSLCRVQIP